MSRPVRARRLTDDEGQLLLRLIRRRGRADAIRYRRGLIILASSSGTPVLAIARLIAADPDTVRDVIHAFNAHGLSVLEPHWGAGRPPRITDQDEAFVVEIARRRPGKLGLPFTHWIGASASSRTTSAAATAAPTRHRCRTGSCGSAGNGCG